MHRLSGASMIQWGNITPARESSTYTLRSHACAQTPAPAPTPVHKNAERLQRPGLQLGPGRPSRPPQLRHRQTDPTRRANSRVTDWTYETSKWPRECASATHLNGRCTRIVLAKDPRSHVRTCEKKRLPQTQTAGCALPFAAPPPPPPGKKSPIGGAAISTPAIFLFCREAPKNEKKELKKRAAFFIAWLSGLTGWSTCHGRCHACGVRSPRLCTAHISPVYPCRWL